MFSDNAIPWAMVIIGGAALLFAALLYGWLKTRKADKQLDPTTPSDDPSKGMTGHD